MSKFICCEDGKYINIAYVRSFYIEGLKNDNGIFLYAIAVSNENGSTGQLADYFSNEEEAQEWLDKFMEKYGLCIEPTTQNRCF